MPLDLSTQPTEGAPGSEPLSEVPCPSNNEMKRTPCECQEAAALSPSVQARRRLTEMPGMGVREWRR